MVPSELSKMSSTVAWLTGLRVEEPEKITSVRLSPRRRLAELSPITQRTASMMFDLPQPFGPTTPVMLVGRCSTVGSTKDLKPDSLMVERRMELIDFQGNRRSITAHQASIRSHRHRPTAKAVISPQHSPASPDAATNSPRDTGQ